MPVSAPRACATVGCGGLVPGGTGQTRCRACTTKHDAERRENYRDARRFYQSTFWRALRVRVLEQQPLCAECAKRGALTPAVEVDHIDGNRLNNARDNLQGLCKSCHTLKTNAQTGGIAERY